MYWVFRVLYFLNLFDFDFDFDFSFEFEFKLKFELNVLGQIVL